MLVDKTTLGSENYTKCISERQHLFKELSDLPLSLSSPFLKQVREQLKFSSFLIVPACM